MLTDADIAGMGPHFDLLQSVRTTFSLAAITETRLELLANSEEVSEKDILHHYSRVVLERVLADKKFAGSASEETKHYAEMEMVRNTRVVTKAALDSIQQLAGILQAKRDRVIDLIISVAARVHNHRVRIRPEVAKEILREYEAAAEEFEGTRVRLRARGETIGITGLFGEDILTIDRDNSISRLENFASQTEAIID